MPFTATWVELEILTLSEMSKKVKYGITYLWNLKYGTYDPIYQIETDQDQEEQTGGS